MFRSQIFNISIFRISACLKLQTHIQSHQISVMQEEQIEVINLFFTKEKKIHVLTFSIGVCI